jgi:hypothetical protein
MDEKDTLNLIPQRQKVVRMLARRVISEGGVATATIQKSSSMTRQGPDLVLPRHHEINGQLHETVQFATGSIHIHDCFCT